MIETTIERVLEGSHPSELADREERLRRHSHSIVLESSFLEMDATEIWLRENIGDRELAWDDYFHYKLGYDYGFVEYFFLTEVQLQLFKKQVPHLFGIGHDGRKFKSRGYDTILDVE